MWRYEILAALAVGAAVVAAAQVSEAGDKHGSGGNHNGNQSSNRSQSFKFPSSSSKLSSFYSQNNKSNHHDDHHGDHHDDHHGDHHHGHHHQPYPVIVRYPYPRPYPVAVPVPVAPPIVTTIPPGGANLVDGINLQLVDVRMADEGDAERNLGPRFRVVIGNRGKQAAGNFQVLAIAAEEAKFSADLPVTMVEVEGIAPGQVAKIDLRLPIRAMTMIDGQPFNLLAVVVDSKKLIDETAEHDNSGMMERTKIEMLDAN